MSDETRPPGRPRVGTVVGGVVLGMLLANAIMIAAFFATYAVSADDEGPVWLWFLPWAAPAVLGAFLLLFPRTRHSGAGLVIGLAVGLIVMPGVCSVPVLTGGLG